VVQVIDQAKGEMIGEITGLSGVHGIAIAPLFGKGFISNGGDHSVTVFDTQTLKTITKITGGGTKPDEIYFEPHSQKVFVFNGKSGNANVIDPKINQIVATIPLAGKPEISVSDEKGKIYVNIEDKSSIAVINTTTYKVEQVWSIAPGQEPTGIALDPKTHRLFSVCANKLIVVVDTESGRVLETLPIGEDPDGAAFDPELKRIYSSNGDGTLTVIQEDAAGKLSVLENMATQKEANTIALNKLTHHIYLSTADFESRGAGKPKVVPNTFVVLDIAPD
jgi:DNA-binding beta-propeller fold protein YncE